MVNEVCCSEVMPLFTKGCKLSFAFITINPQNVVTTVHNIRFEAQKLERFSTIYNCTYVYDYFLFSILDALLKHVT